MLLVYIQARERAHAAGSHGKMWSQVVASESAVRCHRARRTTRCVRYIRAVIPRRTQQRSRHAHAGIQTMADRTSPFTLAYGQYMMAACHCTLRMVRCRDGIPVRYTAHTVCAKANWRRRWLASSHCVTVLPYGGVIVVIARAIGAANHIVIIILARAVTRAQRIYVCARHTRRTAAAAVIVSSVRCGARCWLLRASTGKCATVIMVRHTHTSARTSTTTGVNVAS